MTTLIQTIGKGTALLSISNVISRAVGLLVVFVILRNLTVYEYGLTELVLSIPALLSIFALPGITSAIVADLGILRASGNVVEEARIFKNFFRVQFLLSFFPWAIVFFGAELIAHWYNEGIATMIRVASLSFLFAPLRTSMIIAFQVGRQFTTMTLFSICGEVTKLVTVLLGIYVFHLGAVVVILAHVLLDIIPSLLFYSHYRNITAFMKGITVPWSMAELRTAIQAHGLWSIATSYLNTFSNNIRLWIIKFLLGTEAVGLFGVAMGLYQHTMSLVPLNGILTPLLPQYQANKEQFLRLVSKGMKFQLLGYAVVGVIAATVFPFFISMIFPRFTAAMPLYEVMLIALLFSGVAVVFTPIFSALKEQKRLFQATFIKTLAILILCWPLINIFGLLGIAIEFILTTGVFVLERYRVLRRLVPGFKIGRDTFFAIDNDDRLILNRIHVMTLGRLKSHKN